MIIAMAEKFGQLPDTVEANMSEYWFKRTVVLMDAEALDRQRQAGERERESRRS